MFHCPCSCSLYIAFIGPGDVMLPIEAPIGPGDTRLPLPIRNEYAIRPGYSSFPTLGSRGSPFCHCEGARGQQSGEEGVITSKAIQNYKALGRCPLLWAACKVARLRHSHHAACTRRGWTESGWPCLD